jgi:hypothetical protein
VCGGCVCGKPNLRVGLGIVLIDLVVGTGPLQKG